MLTDGISVKRSNSAFGEMLREGTYIKLPSAYFRKIEKLIGKEQLKENENIAICIWKNDMPVKILILEDGELIENDVNERYPSFTSFQILNFIELEIKKDGGKIYDVVVYEDNFVFYE